jgi:hypothetical protein
MSTYEIKELLDAEAGTTTTATSAPFDPSTLCSGVPFTQAAFYGEWQKALGRTVKRFLVQKKDSNDAADTTTLARSDADATSAAANTVAYFQIIKYPLLRGKSYLYAPYGPVTKDISPEFFTFLKQELKKIARKEDAVFVRLDMTPPQENAELATYFTRAPRSTYHSAYFQPRLEWFLGLQKTEDELLSGMHEKTRYSVRLSERKGIVSEIITENFGRYFDIFFELMDGTAQRNGFSLHAKKYYEHIFANLTSDIAYISIAKFEEKILAIDLVIVFGGILF